MPGSVTPARRAAQARVLYFVIGSVLAALPFQVVDYVPATDLPQHLAQLRMLRELWGLAPPSMDLSDLVVRPFGANTLVYWPMLAISQLCSPRFTGKLTLCLLLLAAVAALHALAWRRARDPAHALLAGILLFSMPLYWGLLNFLCGLPLFWLFCELGLREWNGPVRARALASRVSLLCALYLAHVFWLACAVLVVLVRVLLQRDRQAALRWLACFSPFLSAAALWLPSLVAARRASGVELGASYDFPLAERFSSDWLVRMLLGGVNGFLEPFAVMGILAYVLWVLGKTRSAPRRDHDPLLLTLGASLLVFAVFAPDKVLNTILFNSRVLPCAASLLLLALPASRSRAVSAFALCLSTAFAVVTSLAWSVHAQTELTGLRESLAAVDGPRSVLGLDYRQGDSVLRNRPFLQTFAYFQAEHGGELSFSFAEHQSSIVAFARPRRLHWTQGLEWYPERLQPGDVDAFDCVLVNGSDADHERFAQRFGLSTPIVSGYFRIYCHAWPKASRQTLAPRAESRDVRSTRPVAGSRIVRRFS